MSTNEEQREAPPTPRSDAEQESFEALLEFLKRSREFDFTGYKRPSLQRRIARRMDAVGVATYAEYLDFLQVQPEEYAELFNTILINVTGFLRDPKAWEYIDEHALPAVLGALTPEEEVRVWS